MITGFSDITALLNAIYVQTGMITFHRPEAEVSYTPYMLAEFKKVLMYAETNVVLASPPAFEKTEGNVETLLIERAMLISLLLSSLSEEEKVISSS